MYTRVLVEVLLVFHSEPDLFKHYIKKNTLTKEQSIKQKTF